jgi:hypothetical protein
VPTPFSIPMTPFGYPNVFLPGYMGDREAQARLLVGYALNEDKIAMNKYITVVGSDQAKAYYPVFNSSDFVRLKNTTGNERKWADGADRPIAMQGVRFVNREFTLERYGESTFVGNLAEEYSQIGPLVTINQETLASRALTWRAVVTASVLTDSARYFTTTTPAVNDTYFSTWTTMKTALEGTPGVKPYPTGWFGTSIYAGTIAAPVFKRWVGHTVRTIQRRTNGQVKLSDLAIVANPNSWAKLAATEEMHAYLAQQSGSLAVLKGESPDFDESVFGLPNPIYQVRPISESTTVVLGAPLDSDTDADYGNQTYTLPDDFFAVVSRPGSIAGMKGSMGYSSIVLFQNKSRALKPTTFPDVRSERVEVAMEDMFTLELVAPDATMAVGNAGS